MKLNPIVVATDLSEYAAPAARWAHALATYTQSSVVAGHVIEIGFDSWWRSKYEVLIDEAKHAQAVERIGRWFADATGADPAAIELRVEDCHDGLAQIIEKHAADLLVMSPSGKSGLMQTLVGSRVHEMVARPPCPVAVVHPDHPFEPGGQVAVATDFSAPSEAAIHFAARLAKAANDRLTIVTVIQRPETPALPDLFDELVADLGQAMRERLVEFVDNTLGEGHGAELVVLDGDPIHKTLNDYAEEAKISVLVMGRTGHRSVVGDLLGSVPRTLINRLPCTVVVTPGAPSA